MEKAGMFNSNKSRYFALAAVVIVALLLILTVTVVFFPEKEKTPDRREAGTLYIDTDGTEKFSDDAATEIDAAYLASASYTLGDGWYYVTTSFSLGNNSLFIDGDVHLILANNVTLSAAGTAAAGGIRVTAGNGLSVYAQSDGSDMGRLNRTGSGTMTIILQDDTSLTNTAYISGVTGISAGTGTEVRITNGITGTIRGSGTGISVSSGTVTNDGLIESTGNMYAGIYSSGRSEVFIGETGTIKTVSWGIRLMGGGHIDNAGTIMSTGGATATAIEGAAFMTVINRENALIQGGNDQGIIVGLGGVIENAGTITCTAISGLYIRPGLNSTIDPDRAPLPVTVTNYETGLIYNFYNYRDDLTVTLEAGSTITGTFRMGSGDSTITFSGDPGASLTYATVESTSTLGSGIIGVSIDIAGLPSTIGVGDVLVLIDGGGAISGYPKNSTFSDGGYSFNISVAGDRLIATVTAVPPDPTYGIMLTPPAHTFPAAELGYSAQIPETITVTNTGTAETGGLSAIITGTDASAFTTSTIYIASIAVGGSSTFTVVPKTGLAVGTYTAKITVGPGPGMGKAPAAVSLDVSFTVYAVGTTFGIELDKNTHTFPSATQGYPPRTPVDVTVTNIGTADTGELNVMLSGLRVSSFEISRTSFSDIPAAGMNYDTFTIVPHTGLAPGTYTATITVGPSASNGNPIAPVSIDVSFMVTPSIPGSTNYTINATSDAGSVISPSGAVTVPSGGSRTFTFSATAGYSVCAVIVDGMPLSQDLIDKGSFTFSNVTEDHFIEVRSTADPVITLTIDIVEGRGYAEFSMDGGPFQPYVSAVPIPEGSYLTVNAVADKGFKFREWRLGTETFASSETSFPDVRSSVHLELYFEEKKDSPVLWTAIILLILLGMLLFFLLFYRRKRYDVFMQEFSLIAGDEKAIRKKAYGFTVGGGYVGGVSYRIGEEGLWKMLLPDENGAYVIPREEVTGDIYLENRPA